MRILVTGGAGFIGSNFVRFLSEQPDFQENIVIVLDKFTYAADKGILTEFGSLSNVKIVTGDICDETLVASLIPEVDAVINFAAESHVDRSIVSSAEFMVANINGVHNLIDQIYRSGKKIRFVQVSTDEVYGQIKTGSWDETWPMEPNSPYAASKAAAELILKSYVKTHNCDVLITRGCNNYGPNQFPEKLIPKFITNLLRGENVQLYGNGKNIREWIHVSDHCKGIYEVLQNGQTGETYNIGSGLEISNTDLTLRIFELMGKSPDLITYVQDRKAHDFRYSMNSRKIHTSLNFFPKVTLSQGLTQTIEWYAANEQWWSEKKID